MNKKGTPNRQYVYVSTSLKQSKKAITFKFFNKNSNSTLTSETLRHGGRKSRVLKFWVPPQTNQFVKGIKRQQLRITVLGSLLLIYKIFKTNHEN